MWPGHPPHQPPSHNNNYPGGVSRRQHHLHPVSGQPLVYPPVSTGGGLAHPHNQGGGYINTNYEKEANREMVLIDYADGYHGHNQHPRDSVQVVDLTAREEVSITGHHPALYLTHPCPPPPVHTIMSSDRHYRQGYSLGDTMSRSSDTSSLYSGSDTMASLHSDRLERDTEVDLSGLHESVVDSDEEDMAESIGSFTLRDQVRDCLEKDPLDRGDDDVEVLMEFTHTLEAFADMTQAVRRKMCAVMVFAVVDKAGTVVMNDGEELDSWSVIINGAVRVESSSRSYTLSLGQGFGIKPTMAKEYHQGVMSTVVDDCQFVCITQADYYRILHEGEDALVKEEGPDGDIVKVSEARRVEDGSKFARVLLRATPERLVSQLVEDTSSADPNFIEDFLLCHRMFLKSSLEVVTQLLAWFDRPDLRDRVTRILLLWVNNHFTDFELCSSMMHQLNSFESHLEAANMQGQLRMLNFACAAKARPRTVILTRSSREEELEFTLTGGYARGFGIFVESVDKNSMAYKKGLKRGDQILDVNGENFQQGMTLERAKIILTKQCFLQVNVKSNFLAFKEVTTSSGRKPKDSFIKKDTGSLDQGMDDKMKGMTLKPTSHKPKGTKGKMMALLGNIMKKSSQILNPDDIDDALSDIVNSDGYDMEEGAVPEHSLKVFKADQTHRFLLVNKNTTAREVVMLSLKEFGITECSTNYAMVEVLVDNGFMKERRLADATTNLAQRIGLASRYYIKNVAASQKLVPEEISVILLQEANVNLLQLNPEETATQLMVEDFTVFRQIEQTEYVDWLFPETEGRADSKFGIENLKKFEYLVNKETLWVVTEIVSEANMTKRVKLIKRFLNIAKHCKEAQNFNSMFSIISGLTHTAVSRLRRTWENVPERYSKQLSDMNMIMDPSRNFSRYRNLIKSDSVKPPLIPIYPMVVKDLTFIDIGNKTRVEGLINFEKLRLVAKEIRALTSMCSAPLRNVPDNIIAMNDTEQSGKYTTMRRKGGTRGAPDPKGMYQEALMIRKVKAYLANVKIETDEEILQRMSIEVEPPLTKLSQAANTASSSSLRSGQNRPPSPTPSRSSSVSATSEGKSSLKSKFGASSPERERKLLSLAESVSREGKARHQASKLLHGPKLSKSSYSLSPGPSPNQLRRDSLKTDGGVPGHERSQSESHPVSLTAESCSVASLPGYRRGSISSQDSHTDTGTTISGQTGVSGTESGRIELPPRAGGAACVPPRPPEYQAVRARVSRTQSRDSHRSTEDETQVSAV